MKAYGGMEVPPTILDLGTMWSSLVSFAPWPLYPRYPLDRRLDWPRNRSGRCGWKKNLPLSGTERWMSNPQPVATPTELPWLVTVVQSPWHVVTNSILRNTNKFPFFIDTELDKGNIWNEVRLNKFNFKFRAEIAALHLLTLESPVVTIFTTCFNIL
jgi:hypothetical protein